MSASSNTDHLLKEAARIVVLYKNSTPSFIQRKLKITYENANALIEELERAGIVGPYRAHANRKIFPSTEMQMNILLKLYQKNKLVEDHGKTQMEDNNKTNKNPSEEIGSDDLSAVPIQQLDIPQDPSINELSAGQEDELGYLDLDNIEIDDQLPISDNIATPATSPIIKDKSSRNNIIKIILIIGLVLGLVVLCIIYYEQILTFIFAAIAIVILIIVAFFAIHIFGWILKIVGVIGIIIGIITLFVDGADGLAIIISSVIAWIVGKIITAITGSIMDSE